MKIRYLKNKKRSVLTIAIILAVFFVLVPNKSLARTVEVKPQDFTTYFTTTGDAKPWDGEKVILTQNKKSQVGAFYLNKRIDTVGSFTLEGEVFLGTKTDKRGGADGMAFIFHPNDQEIEGETGGSLGMLGIPNVQGFRLDTHYNSASKINTLLPDDWPALGGEKKDGKAETPFGGFASTDSTGWSLTYDYDSNQRLTKSKFLKTGSKPVPITIKYDNTGSLGGTLTITLDGQVWSKVIESTGESMAFQVKAATGTKYNEQYFVFKSFTFEESRQITVKEVWEHTGNEGNEPPGGYTLLKDNEPVGEPYITDSGTEVTSYTKDDLDDNGNYSIKATPVKNYELVSVVPDDNDPDSYTITRKYNPNETKITVKDTWDDNDDSYGLRPETSSFQMKANDTTLDDIYQNSADKNWAQEITLPERDNDGKGDPITYSVVVPDDVPDYDTDVIDNKDGSFEIKHTLQRVIKLISVPELLKWTDRTIPIPNKVLNRDENNPMTITVKNTMSDDANWKVAATLKDTGQSDKLYSLIWKEDDNVSDAEAKDLVGIDVLTNQSAIPNANQTYLYEKTWGADAGILLKTKDYVPIGEHKGLTIQWTLENVAGNE